MALLLAVDDARPGAVQERGDVSAARAVLRVGEQELAELVKTTSALLLPGLWPPDPPRAAARSALF